MPAKVHVKVKPASRPWAFQIQREGQLMINVDGDQLFRKEWRLKADEKPRAALFIVHGAGDHCMRYDHLAKKFNDMGVFVFSHDHVGHGQSTGIPVHIEDFQIYVRDVIADIAETKRTLPPSTPLFLIGISMGGAVTAHVALQRPDLISGAILNAPAIVPDPATAKPYLIAIARIVAKRFPMFGIDKLNPNYMTRSPEELRIGKADKLIYHGKMKARWGMEMLGAMLHVQAHVKELTVPLFVQQGDQDHICNPEGARLLQTGTSSPDVTVKFYPGMYHDLLHEIPEDTATVIRDILDWVDVRINGGPLPAAAAAAAPAAAAPPAAPETASPAAPVPAAATSPSAESAPAANGAAAAAEPAAANPPAADGGTGETAARTSEV